MERNLGYRARRRRNRSAGAGSATAGAATAGAEAGVRYRGRDSRGARRWVLGALAVVLIIAGVVVSTLFAIGISRADAENDRRAEYSAFARDMLVNLTSLNSAKADEALKYYEQNTSGRARQQMQDSMPQTVELIKKSNTDTESSIIADAVTKAEPEEGTVIAVLGWRQVSREPNAQPIYQTFRWRVNITRINGALKMTNFEWVT
ncbi:hypothetical protein [Gordonia soli]|uniref:hypothetical protein n=1 Tax=Gordonia soli TaxID=320799 RepID=UPI0012F7D268|nr:hypothetical protein [Gordonia soli]